MTSQKVESSFMFLIFDNEISQHIFVDSDPRDDGFMGDIIANVTLYIPEDLNEWPDGARCPQPALAVSQTDRTNYQVFKYDTEARAAGFRVIGARPVNASSYAAYLRSVHQPIPQNLKTYLTNVWNSVGRMILRNGGIEDPSPSLKRRLLRGYMDGEPVTNDNARRFWRPLTDREKVIHLFYVFPDDLAFAE